MSKPQPPKENPSPPTDNIRIYGPWVFAAIILIGYALFVNYLVGKTNAENDEWIKLTYIFGSVEAIVFTAVGFIFGREVNRSRAIKAEQNEAKAKKEKQKLAEEILKQLPDPPGPDPDPVKNTFNNLSGLRGMAQIYLEE